MLFEPKTVLSGVTFDSRRFNPHACLQIRYIYQIPVKVSSDKGEGLNGY